MATAKTPAPQPEAVRLEEMPGFEFLRPVNTIKASVKGRLMAALDLADDDDLNDSEMLLVMCDIMDMVSKYATFDSEAFDAWSAEDGNFNPALELASAFISRLGESLGGSTTSDPTRK